MAILNITYNGRSTDVMQQVDDRLSDVEVTRLAVKLVRNGELAALHVRDLPNDAFRYFVVDRLRDPVGTLRIYLRPKVPFGAR